MRRAIASLLFFLLIMMSLIVTVEPSNSALTKPSVPEFTVESISYPYDVPTTHTTDPFSGETITHQGYHVENRTTVLKVKNQPFSPYTVNGSEINLYYQVRMKGHYMEDGWFTQFSAPNNYPKRSTSEYTIISPQFYVGGYDFQAGDKIDIQVKALVGSVVFVNGRMWGGSEYYTFEGLEGDWSGTYVYAVEPSVTPSVSPPIPTPTQSDSQTVTSTPNTTVPENSAELDFNLLELGIFLLLAVIAVLLVFVVVYLRKKSKN